jgi:hypothetical protein
MEIKIGNSSEYLILKNIYPEGGDASYGQSDFYTVTLKLNINGITTNIGTSILIGELSQFYEDLGKLYETLKHSFVFSSIEDNVELHFAPTVTGQIEIKGYLRNSDYSGKIDFTIETDQSYLPTSMEQLKEVLIEIKNKS